MENLVTGTVEFLFIDFKGSSKYPQRSLDRGTWSFVPSKVQRGIRIGTLQLKKQSQKDPMCRFWHIDINLTREEINMF
jgi:hypothetical protein